LEERWGGVNDHDIANGDIAINDDDRRQQQQRQQQPQQQQVLAGCSTGGKDLVPNLHSTTVARAEGTQGGVRGGEEEEEERSEDIDLALVDPIHNLPPDLLKSADDDEGEDEDDEEYERRRVYVEERKRPQVLG
jgi:hypothetical protein